MMENHNECSDVTILENIVKDVKTSDIFNEIEELIIEMTESIVPVFHRLSVFLLQSVPSSDHLVNCQGDY
jgi:hypothetical protein